MAMKLESSRVMTVKELSDYLKVHPSTVYRQLKRGGLPAFKVGSDWRFNIESIESLAATAGQLQGLRAPRELGRRRRGLFSDIDWTAGER